DTLLPVKIIQEVRQVGRKHSVTDPAARKEQDYFLLICREGRRNLRTDEPTPDHRKALPFHCPIAQAPIVPQGAKVDDVITTKWQSAGRAAGGQEKLVKRVDLPLIVGHGLQLRINGVNRPPEMEVHFELVCMPPDAVQRFASPELFAQRRPVVR